MNWRPISTAPQDGTPVLGCRNDDPDYSVYEMRWEPSYGWGDPKWDGQYDPTHWMPKPERPGAESGYRPACKAE